MCDFEEAVERKTREVVSQLTRCRDQFSSCSLWEELTEGILGPVMDATLDKMKQEGLIRKSDDGWYERIGR